MLRKLAAFVAAVAIAAGVCAAPARSQDDTEIKHRAKVRVQPAYPDLAKKLNISGTVKVKVTVAPNGKVMDAKAVGGHPVLVGAAVDAAKKWIFEPAPTETSGIVEFTFERRP